MIKPHLAFSINGSGHYIEECLKFLRTLDCVNACISQAGEELLKHAPLNSYKWLYADELISAVQTCLRQI